MLKIENPIATDQAQSLNNSIQVAAKMHSKKKKEERFENALNQMLNALTVQMSACELLVENC